MKAASRTVGAIAGGAGGFVVGGPVGAVAGGIAGGAAVDGITTGVDSAIKGEYRPSGSATARSSDLFVRFLFILFSVFLSLPESYRKNKIADQMQVAWWNRFRTWLMAKPMWVTSLISVRVWRWMVQQAMLVAGWPKKQVRAVCIAPCPRKPGLKVHVFG